MSKGRGMDYGPGALCRQAHHVWEDNGFIMGIEDAAGRMEQWRDDIIADIN